MTTALILPSEEDLKKELYAIGIFQALVRANLKEGVDYGVIPGTKKPSLLKPGAEKTTKLLGLADTYEVMQRVENWDKPFFNYEVKCTLIQIGTGTVISEGLGSCNSWESKYRYRWVFPDDVPQSIDKAKLVKKTGKRRDGKGTYVQYRLDNEDIYSQVNTLLKMAEKRALVDAALHAGRLSDLFTQDIEDGAIIDADYTVVEESEPKPKPKSQSKEASGGKIEPEASPEVNCNHCEFSNEQDLCDKGHAERQPGEAGFAPQCPDFSARQPEPVEEAKPIINMDWLEESLKTLQAKKLKAWSDSNLLSYMKTTYKIDASTVLEAVAELDKGQATHFTKRVQEAVDASILLDMA
jgi:hypothetical protein